MASLQSVRNFVQSTPGAEWWVEELLFRGGRGLDGGVVSGAHVTVGVRYTEPDGDLRVRTFGPFPVNATPNNAAMRALVGEVVIAQQSQIDQQAADLSAKDTTIEQQAATIAARDARIAELEAQIDPEA